MNHNNTQSAENLLQSFMGESKAFTKYMIYAERASEEGYFQISKLFQDIAFNERAHAQIWLEEMGKVRSTLDNIQDCIAGEAYESQEMYPQFSKTAALEGLPELAHLFHEVGEVENHHKQIFLRYAKMIEDGTLYHKNYRTHWLCLNCGHIHYGSSAPTPCPVCSHPQDYFVEQVEC